MSHNDNIPETQAMSKLLGTIVVVRNGDREEYYQDPKTYKGSPTETTALGEAESFQLGSYLRQTYLNSDSPDFIKGINAELVDNSELKVLAKSGGEATVVFDSVIALLQGLYPPTSKNKITLANSTVVTAPLGGYQYVPVETVEPANDRSLESWTDCPNFRKHAQSFYDSKQFKEVSRDAQYFFSAVRDFVFGRTASLENAWNIYDFMHSQYIHNKTYAHRLPPTFIEQARGFANFHEQGVFSDKELAGPGNIAGRTILGKIVHALERVAFNGDPLQFGIIETTYHPFISIFSMLDILKKHPELKGFPDYSSALSFELRRGSPPDTRDFLRLRFKNGTMSPFETLHVFEHHADIPVTEFIYRLEAITVNDNKQWAQACGNSNFKALDFVQNKTSGWSAPWIIFAVLFFGMLFRFVRRARNTRRVKLEGQETILPTQEKITAY